MSWNLMMMEEDEEFINEFKQAENPRSLSQIISEQKLDPSINQLMQWLARHTVPTKDELAKQTPFVKSLAQ